jgi:hypothetical protein
VLYVLWKWPKKWTSLVPAKQETCSPPEHVVMKMGLVDVYKLKMVLFWLAPMWIA